VAADKCVIDEIRYLLLKRLIFKTPVSNNSNDFEIKLNLRKSIFDDIFHCEKFLKQYQVYYVVNPEKGTVVGPEHTTFETNLELLKGLVERGMIYIPNKNNYLNLIE